MKWTQKLVPSLRFWEFLHKFAYTQSLFFWFSLYTLTGKNNQLLLYPSFGEFLPKTQRIFGCKKYFWRWLCIFQYWKANSYDNLNHTRVWVFNSFGSIQFYKENALRLYTVCCFVNMYHYHLNLIWYCSFLIKIYFKSAWLLLHYGLSKRISCSCLNIIKKGLRPHFLSFYLYFYI